MNATYFRPRRLGPEIKIEDAVAKQVPHLFPGDGHVSWMARSLPLGASMPDLLIVACNPQISSLSDFGMLGAYILSYLRSVNRVRIDTIIERISSPKKKILRCLNNLIEANVVIQNSSVFSLSPSWRDILSEIVTVEAKVKNWKTAVEQAVRNRVFAHKSYIALPAHIAERIRTEPVLKYFGIGLLSVNNNDVRVTRRARRHQPRIWAYYYKLAFLAASHFTK